MSDRELDEFRIVAERIVAERLAHYGYTPDEVAVMMQPVDHAEHGCEFDSNHMCWDCRDENDESRHQMHDEAEETAEFVVWVLEALPTTIEARIEAATAQAMGDVERLLANARRDALTEAADAWQINGWANVLLPRPTPPAIPVIADAQAVTDWLRDRAGTP